MPLPGLELRPLGRPTRILALYGNHKRDLELVATILYIYGFIEEQRLI
jgi:hypothetical protein